MLKETDNKVQKNGAAEDILKVNILFCYPEISHD